VPDAGHGVWILAAAVAIAAMAATSALVRHSLYGRLGLLVKRLVKLLRMTDSEDAARRQAVLFESVQVCAEIVTVSRRIGNAELCEKAVNTQKRMEEWFRDVSSGVRPTSDNVKAFQDQLRSLGRGMSDGMRKADGKDGR